MTCVVSPATMLWCYGAVTASILLLHRLSVCRAVGTSPGAGRGEVNGRYLPSQGVLEVLIPEPHPQAKGYYVLVMQQDDLDNFYDSSTLVNGSATLYVYHVRGIPTEQRHNYLILVRPHGIFVDEYLDGFRQSPSLVSIPPLPPTPLPLPATATLGLSSPPATPATTGHLDILRDRLMPEIDRRHTQPEEGDVSRDDGWGSLSWTALITFSVVGFLLLALILFTVCIYWKRRRLRSAGSRIPCSRNSLSEYM